MWRPWAFAGLSGCLFLLLIPLVVVLLLVKLLWAWTIPDLFPGAVQQGSGSIGWLTSLKVAIFAAILAALAGVRRG